MRITSGLWVCSVDGIRHRVVDSVFVLLLAFATIPAILGLSGCSGLVSAKSSTGTPGVLSANPSSISFGDVSVGSSATQSLSITNTGTQTVNISTATISGTNLTFAGGSSSIPAGQSSTIQIQFVPQSVGDVVGTFSVTSNASNSLLSVSVQGRGKGPRLTVSPASLNFGNVALGQTSTQSAQLTNSGNVDLVVNVATVLGNGFGISGLSLPAMISVGQSVACTVQFAPTTAGGVSGSISFTNNAPGSPYTLAVTGSGVAAAVAPSISTQPISQAVTVGQTASFSVVATGTAPLSYQWRKNSVVIVGA
ncbi:MAG TPA: choice-of-anchor D domain-containing protein, partial [Candidatus Acidoferrum sp.]